MLRHNSNVLKPDPSKVVELKALSEKFFNSLSQKCCTIPLSYIDPIDWLESKTDWTKSKKNKYFS